MLFSPPAPSLFLPKSPKKAFFFLSIRFLGVARLTLALMERSLHRFLKARFFQPEEERAAGGWVFGKDVRAGRSW